MQPIYHFIPEEESLRIRLQQRLAVCNESILATAFFTYRAFSYIRDSLESSLELGAKHTFLLGRYEFITEPRAVEALLELSTRYPKKVNVFFDGEYYFHYKLAVFKCGNRKVVIIGSSNLTPNGLLSHGEVNLEVAGDANVYNQAKESVIRRLAFAELAEDGLAEYRKHYHAATKYRRQRQRWMRRGRKQWKSKPHKSSSSTTPCQMSYPFCWISELVDDKTLDQNVRDEHSIATNDGVAVPFQYINVVDKRFAKKIAEGSTLFVCDAMARTFGFAECKRNCNIMDGSEKPQPIIFYRFLRGWKSKKMTRAEFKKVSKKLGLTDRATLGSTTSKRVMDFLESVK